MNAQQRRVIYRKIKRMIGTTVSYTLSNPCRTITNTGVVVGLTDNVISMSSNNDNSTFNCMRPSVHRLRVELPSGHYQSPRLSILHKVRK